MHCHYQSCEVGVCMVLVPMLLQQQSDGNLTSNTRQFNAICILAILSQIDRGTLLAHAHVLTRGEPQVQCCSQYCMHDNYQRSHHDDVCCMTAMAGQGRLASATSSVMEGKGLLDLITDLNILAFATRHVCTHRFDQKVLASPGSRLS